MTEELPRFCGILNQLIKEIATKRGEDPEEFRVVLLRKIRDNKGAVDKGLPAPSTATASSVNTKTRLKEVYHDG